MSVCSAEDIDALKKGLRSVSKILRTVENVRGSISGTQIEEINNSINFDCLSNLGASDPSISRDVAALVQGLRAAVPQLKIQGNPRPVSSLKFIVKDMVKYLDEKYPVTAATPAATAMAGGKKNIKRRNTKRRNTRRRNTRRRRYTRHRK